jgi:hypothetical protein
MPNPPQFPFPPPAALPAVPAELVSLEPEQLDFFKSKPEQDAVSEHLASKVGGSCNRRRCSMSKLQVGLTFLPKLCQTQSDVAACLHF